MEQLFGNEKVKLNLRVTPVLTVFQGKRNSYTLLDSAYGEWLIYENDYPRYYFNIYEPAYAGIKDSVLSNGDVVSFIEKILAGVGGSLKTKDRIKGLKLHSKSTVVKLEVDKLPAAFFSSAVNL